MQTSCEADGTFKISLHAVDFKKLHAMIFFLFHNTVENVIPNEENINLLCRRLVVETFNQSARRR